MSFNSEKFNERLINIIRVYAKNKQDINTRLKENENKLILAYNIGVYRLFFNNSYTLINKIKRKLNITTNENIIVNDYKNLLIKINKLLLYDNNDIKKLNENSNKIKKLIPNEIELFNKKDISPVIIYHIINSINDIYNILNKCDNNTCEFILLFHKIKLFANATNIDFSPKYVKNFILNMNKFFNDKKFEEKFILCLDEYINIYKEKTLNNIDIIDILKLIKKCKINDEEFETKIFGNKLNKLAKVYYETKNIKIKNKISDDIGVTIQTFISYNNKENKNIHLIQYYSIMLIKMYQYNIYISSDLIKWYKETNKPLNSKARLVITNQDISMKN